MLSEPRAIRLETQFQWPPLEAVPFRVTPEVVRELYNLLHTPEFNDFAYANLSLQPPPGELTTTQETGSHSRCRVTREHLSITEDDPTIVIDDFIKRIQAVGTTFSRACNECNLDDVHLFIQRCKVHCLTQPNECPHGALELLASRVANVLTSIEPFNRPPAFFGVRFRFPPAMVKLDDGTESTHENFSTVRFETYSENESQVWMEVASTYLLGGMTTLSEALGDSEKQGQIEENMRESYNFLTESCKNFLDQFDVKREGETGHDENDS